jgi:hypothetical protein
MERESYGYLNRKANAVTPNGSLATPGKVLGAFTRDRPRDSLLTEG